MEPTDGKRIDDFDIAVINLDRRPDRMSHLYNHAPIMFRRFPAIDGTNLSKHYFQFSDLLDTIRNQHRVLGEVGCSLSHYSLWKEHIERRDGHGRASGHEHLLIFEDDVMFTDRSREQYKRMTREISHGVVEKGFQFDLIYVGGQWTSHYDIDGSNAPYFNFQKTTKESLETHYRQSLVPNIYKRRNLSPAVIQGERNVWYSPLFRTAGAYVISQRGAKRLLEAVETDTALFMKTPLDMWLLEMDFRGYIDAFDYFPHPFYQAGFEMVREPSHAANDIHRGQFETIDLPYHFPSPLQRTVLR
jgi:GR25 family glycosyltransferase involved in LPS biosynthesis